MPKRTVNKILRGTLKHKKDALKMQEGLYRRYPDGSFKIEGKRDGFYYVYQVGIKK